MAMGSAYVFHPTITLPIYFTTPLSPRYSSGHGMLNLLFAHVAEEGAVFVIKTVFV